MALLVTTLTVGQMEENCYIVFDRKTHEALIIDPGDDAEYISQKLADLDAQPTQIIATHAHFDHIQAVLPLQLAYNIPFLMHKGDTSLLKHYRQSTKHFTGFDPGPPPKITKLLEGKETLHLNESKFKILEVPGHTPGSIAIYQKEADMVFVGDVIFEGGTIGRTDHRYSDKKAMLKSIEKLLLLPKDTVVYSGHGEPTTIGDFISLFPLL